jgi:Leucine-rich repeat (LRR) protein
MSQTTATLFLYGILSIFINYSRGQVILDQAYLHNLYPSYESTQNMDFKLHNIVHVDHFTFAGANAVQSINLSNNSISVISQAFNQYLFTIVYRSATWAPATHFNNLLDINLSHNKIIHIDTDSFLAAFCQILDLSYNSLTRIHANQLFTKWATNPNPIKINTLKLNNNQLSDISGLFSYGSTLYPHLAHVYLNSNKITRIEADTFRNVKSLTHLYLNDNKITSIDGLAFQGLVNLRQVYMHGNPVVTISNPSEISQIWQVMQLCASANPQCIICFSAACQKSDLPQLDF